MEWDAFLAIKCQGDMELFRHRKSRIDSWVASNPLGADGVSPASRELWKEEVAIVSASIDQAWKKLKDQKKKDA